MPLYVTHSDLRVYIMASRYQIIHLVKIQKVLSRYQSGNINLGCYLVRWKKKDDEKGSEYRMQNNHENFKCV